MRISNDGKNTFEGTDMRPLLKVEQAADILNVNYGTMRTWISKGYFPVVKLGQKLVRIRQEDLETYILEHRKGGADVH